jgi:hypothetical protein
MSQLAAIGYLSLGDTECAEERLRTQRNLR